MPEELQGKEKIAKVLQQFAQEEVGNRLSQFAMLSLQSIILDEVDKIIRRAQGKEG